MTELKKKILLEWRIHVIISLKKKGKVNPPNSVKNKNCGWRDSLLE